MASRTRHQSAFPSSKPLTAVLINKMLTQSFLALLLLATQALTTPLTRRTKNPISIPIARRVNATSAKDLLKFDQARAKAFKNRPSVQPHQKTVSAAEAAFGVPVTNQAVDYAMSARFL